MRLIFKTIAGAALAMGLLALIVPMIERQLMYFPNPTYVTPSAAGLQGVTEIVLEPEDGARVVAWYAPAQSGQPTILYFHGNAGSLEHRTERFRRYTARGFGLFMMSYRGYSGSSGKPSEAANVADGKLAYDTLTGLGIEASDIIVYGESLGTSIAVQVAAARDVAGLILDAPYTSMVELAGLHYPVLHVLGQWFMYDRYETSRHIKSVTAPLLVIHGEADEIVPVAMGREIFTLASPPKTIKTFPGAGHADHYLYGSYDAIFAWIATLDRQQAMRRQG